MSFERQIRFAWVMAQYQLYRLSNDEKWKMFSKWIVSDNYNLNCI